MDAAYNKIAMKFFPLAALLLTFLFFKLFNASVHLSDTNIYFYTAYQLSQGKLLYSDIFFTNFPLFPYIAVFYFFLGAKSLLAFYATSAIEIVTITLLLSKIIYKQTKSIFLTTLTATSYIFSFIVLTTSDHQTGVFTASLLAVLSYYFFIEKGYSVSGIFSGMMLMTKAYFIPIFIAIAATLFLQKQYKNLRSLLVSSAASIIILLIPSLYFSPKEFLTNVFQYSLTRAQGLSKIEIAWFFITHDFLLFSLLIFNVLAIKRFPFFGILSLLSLLFFALYKDTYYLYLNFAIPFLLLSLPSFLRILQTKLRLQANVLPTIIIVLLFFNITTYLSSYKELQKINANEMVRVVKKEQPIVLYGANDITPALAYLSNTPLLGSIIDTNESIFRKGYLNKDTLTQHALEQHAMVIVHGISYPSMELERKIANDIIDQKKIEKHCRLVKSIPVTTEGIINRVNFFQC